ncbi:MAG: low molecular weight protein-tyrosine-phosphatase [Bacteroidia bacterium]
MKILFVCLGNICRSPLAEAIFNDLLEKKGLTEKYLCDSAGTASYHIGKQPDNRTIEVAEKNNVPINHRARQFTKTDFNNFDLIIAMDRNNLRDIDMLKPYGVKAKVKLMRNFDNQLEQMDVPDPYYGNMNDFNEVYEILKTCCENLIHKLENDVI